MTTIQVVSEWLGLTAFLSCRTNNKFWEVVTEKKSLSSIFWQFTVNPPPPPPPPQKKKKKKKTTHALKMANEI